MLSDEEIPSGLEQIGEHGTILAGARYACARRKTGSTDCWGNLGRKHLAFDPSSSIKTFDGRVLCELVRADLRCLRTESGETVYGFGAYGGKIVAFSEPNDQRVCALVDSSNVVCALSDGGILDITTAFPKGTIDQLADTGEYICVHYLSGELVCAYPEDLKSKSMFVGGGVEAPKIPDSFKAVKLTAGKFYRVCAISDKDSITCGGISSLEGGLAVPDGFRDAP
jgi:hypothetical protein